MKKLIYSSLLAVTPALAFAQDGRIGSLLRDILNFIGDVVNFLGPLFIAIALLAFFYSLIMYLYKRDEMPEAGTYLWRSILVLFVMVSIWGIIAFIRTNLGIGDGRDLVDTPRVFVPDVQ